MYMYVSNNFTTHRSFSGNAYACVTLLPALISLKQLFLDINS